MSMLHTHMPFSSSTWGHTSDSNGLPHQLSFFTLPSNFSQYLLLSKMFFSFTLVALFLIYLVIHFTSKNMLLATSISSLTFSTRVELKGNGRRRPLGILSEAPQSCFRNYWQWGRDVLRELATLTPFAVLRRKAKGNSSMSRPAFLCYLFYLW